MLKRRDFIDRTNAGRDRAQRVYASRVLFIFHRGFSPVIMLGLRICEPFQRFRVARNLDALANR